MTTSRGKVGFIGLGSMGGPMALNIAKAGFATKAFDLRAEAVSSFVSASSAFFTPGTGATSVVDAAQGADFLILMVVNDAQARSILLSPTSTEALRTALSVLAPNAHVILMATCSPGSVLQLSQDIQTARSDIVLVDAPVSGGVSGSTNGTLTIMVGCPTAAFDHVRPVLGAMGDKLHHMGEEPGKGNSMKAINQVLCGIHVAAAAEALALAKKMGVDASHALEIVSTSAASSWMLRDRGPRMLQDEPETHSMTQIFVKDLGIVAEAGREVGAALPLSVAAHQMFVAGVGRGQKYMDDSSVIRCYDALNGQGE
ncbi:6-phosphogluconate dehydrogenase, NADP-binding [Kalmanozyma brasiliensis GHG001]|uniref:6-phosphogluconate dehydrogenase, NADP-binding n=1 Tax=Kalmanozyma brasiliensis (strain GHG001) TaxID=1365824 RepID=UPI0028682ABE|nr:6-phosphogluconate dehydrogenase, NADP-binding [Kalmanozyma brasiliensis GHG001]KAF6767174.1 6-phosphogluconate dehydrogenase, NADP-binding [Kalmanozyma brasiliensis GHG001]